MKKAEPVSGCTETLDTAEELHTGSQSVRDSLRQTRANSGLRKSQHGEGTWEQISPLAEALLAFDSSWEKGNQVVCLFACLFFEECHSW